MDRPPLAARLAEGGVRFLYLGAAIALTWASGEWFKDVTFHVNQTSELAEGAWFAHTLATIVAGVLLGLAIRPFGGAGDYRWGIALALGIAPLVLVVANYVVLTYAGSRAYPPLWLIELYRFPGPWGHVLGLAIVAGFTTREPATR